MIKYYQKSSLLYFLWYICKHSWFAQERQIPCSEELKLLLLTSGQTKVHLLQKEGDASTLKQYY